MSDDFHIAAFRQVPRTGVIFVTGEATRLGFSPRNPDWCNLGQGQPETGELPAPPAPDARVPGASARARAESQVRTAADGSRHAVLGGAIRSWTVATIDDQGRLLQDCVKSQTEAQKRIDATAKPAVRK